MATTHEVIKHQGVVTGINGNMIAVKIVSVSACAACHAKGACTMADMQEKQIDVWVAQPEKYSINQLVWVEMLEQLALSAVLLAYFFPSVCIVSGLFVFIHIGMAELWAALCSIGLGALYFLLLIPFRKKLRKRFAFGLRAGE